MNMRCLKINEGKLVNYTWRHLCNSSSAKIAKFKKHTRIGVFGSDWVSGDSWGSPIVALAPPLKNFTERSGDSRLGLDVHKSDIFSRFGLVSSENRWAVIYPPP